MPQPVPTAPLRPITTRPEPTSPPPLWSHLETPQQLQLAQLLATLIRRQRTASAADEEVHSEE